jgi:hypothetical protein
LPLPTSAPSLCWSSFVCPLLLTYLHEYPGACNLCAHVRARARPAFGKSSQCPWMLFRATRNYNECYAVFPKISSPANRDQAARKARIAGLHFYCITYVEIRYL